VKLPTVRAVGLTEILAREGEPTGKTAKEASMKSPLFRVATNGGQAPAIPIVTGEHIAKATGNYGPQQRADDAARWLRGELSIKPTVALAARTFGVSVPLVVEAHEQHERRQRAKRCNGGIAV
jgi:hypothetical protein